MLSTITLLERNGVWNFFVTSHDIGPVDDIGRTTKRLVSSGVTSGNTEVTTSSEFAKVAARKCKNILIKHISKAGIEAEIPKLNDDGEGISPILNTKHSHWLHYL